MERTITIGFLGCGNVGGGVWKLLNGFADDIAHRTGLRFPSSGCWCARLQKSVISTFQRGF